MNDAQLPHQRPCRDTVIAQTRHLRLVDRGGWSFARRRGHPRLSRAADVRYN